MSSHNLPTVGDFTLADVTVRPAVIADMPGKRSINAYYVEHTVTEFDYTSPTLDEAIAELEMYNEGWGSYLVAVAHDTDVLGWVQISTHRCATGGWARTKELSIFVHPDHLHKGIGTKLLDKMFHVLAHPEGYDERWISPSLRDEGRVRTIFAVIAVAASERDNKDRRMDFYRKMGFEPVGLLKNAGWKFDQWVDTWEIQKHVP